MVSVLNTLNEILELIYILRYRFFIVATPEVFWILLVLFFRMFLKLLPIYWYENVNPCAIFCSVITIVFFFNKIIFRLTSQSLCVTSFSSPFIYLLPSKHSNCTFILGNSVTITINSTLHCRTSKLKITLNGYTQKLRYDKSCKSTFVI